MAKILFGQDLIADVEADLRFAVGKPGLPYAYNVNFEVLKSLIAGSGSVVTVENTTVYDPLEIYEAGNIFVSFVNEDSSSPFDTAALYRSRETTEAGISPEDSLYNVDTNPSGKWEYQGTSVISQDGGLGAIFYNNEASIKAITGYKNGDNVVNIETGDVYEYNDAEQIGLKPNNHFGIYGRWRYRFRVIKSDQSTKQTLTSSPKIQDLTADRLPYVSADKSIKSSGFLNVDEVNKRLGINKIETPTESIDFIGNMRGGLTETDLVSQQMSISMRHFNKAYNNVSLLTSLCNTSQSFVFWGGSGGNAVTDQRFFTSSSGNNGGGGTEAGRIDNQQRWAFGTTSATERVTVGGNIKASGSVQIGDRQTTASATLKGTTRYREGAGYSVTEMCMQISATEYAWKEIVRNEW